MNMVLLRNARSIHVATKDAINGQEREEFVFDMGQKKSKRSIHHVAMKDARSGQKWEEFVFDTGLWDTSTLATTKDARNG